MGGKSANSTRKKKGGTKPVRTDWHETFLKGLRDRCTVSFACQAAGVDRSTVYIHRERFPEFAEKWDEAVLFAKEALEARAYERAMEESDTLTIFLLKAYDPARFRETHRYEITGPDGGPVKIAAPAERDSKLAELLNKGLGSGGDDTDG